MANKQRKASQAGLELPSSPSSSHLLSFPRSTSPSGFQGFLTKSARWLSRTTSAPKPPPSQALPRLSGSSRRPTISGPSDPRPILATPGSGLGVSQSVLDLSAPYGLERIEDNSPTPSVLGDLNVATGRTWSRSVEDLSSFSSAPASRSASKARIENYRKGSGSSAEPPSVPFPSVSPQRDASAITASPSLPAQPLPHSPSSPAFTYRVNAPAQQDPPQHTHVRSKSQGAHHASHLKQPTIVPPSPPKVRSKTEGSSQKRRPSFEKDRPHAGFGPIPAFTFGFAHHRGSPEPSGSSSTPAKPAQPSTSHEVVSDKEKLSPNPVRNSQIVQVSGFVNRLNLSSKFASQNLEKGWKPYKAQVKGTKLFFYKPPHDKASEIKDLFLTGPTPIELPPEPEPVTEVDIPESGSRSRLRDRKRAYWGRARHAELVVSDTGDIVSGPPEALIHEVVFATTLKLRPNRPESPSPSISGEPEDPRWRDFAVALLLCLPSYMEKPKFEAELNRNVMSFDRGASDEERTANRPRLRWLLDEYVRLHGNVEDEPEWKVLMEATVMPDPEVMSIRSDTTARPVELLSTGNIPGGRPPVRRGTSGDSTMGTGRTKLASLLEEEGLSRDTFTRLDPRKVAESLLMFERTKLQKVHPADFLTRLENDAISYFAGSEDHPHWLTRLVIEMVLGQVTKSDARSAGAEDDGPGNSKLNSATYIRAGVVTRWIQIGERCRLIGDACSWKAIMAGLCCIPVARLEKVWRRVEESERKVVEDWVRGDRRIDEEMYTPWADNVRSKSAEALDFVRVSGQPNSYKVDVMVDVAQGILDVSRTWAACLKLERNSQVNSSVVTTLLAYWETAHLNPSPRITSVNQSLPLSFSIEPRQGGRYQSNFWKPPTGYGASQSILPLLFPEPLPTISLLDRNALIRAKKDTLLGPTIEVDESQVQKLTHTSTKSAKQKTIAEVELDETLIPCFNGELVLKLPRDDMKSRPVSFIESLPPIGTPPEEAKTPTRGNSIRLSPAARLERKNSQIRLSRRSSLPSISQRNSLLVPDTPTTETQIRVTIKSGTLDRLVDVLVSGLEGVSVTHTDDNYEMPLRDGKSKSFRVDRMEFNRVWWAGFRSFVTPIVLFELLRKRFGGLSPSGAREFDPAKASEIVPTNQLRLNVLNTLSHWLVNGGGAQDVLDDLELYLSIRSFLSSKTPGASADVERSRESLYRTFLSLVSRPVLDTPSNRESRLLDGPTRKFGAQPPLLENITPEDFVDNIDSIAQTVFRGVTEGQMFVLADILEAQTADRTGWFLPRDQTHVYDNDVVIQDLYNHLQMVEPSPMVASSGHHDHLYKFLNPSLRTVIRSHLALRDWVLLKLADPNVQPGIRMARMALLVHALALCRSKVADPDASAEEDDIRHPTVRSFVEGVIVSAILSPESRAYAKSWNEVAGSRSTSVEDLLALLGDDRPPPTSSKPLTLDPAWIMERMIEIITLPDVAEADGQTLVNLDKRRYLHNLIVNTAGLMPRLKRASEAERQDMERLNAMGRETQTNLLDMRAVREAAQREAAHLSFNHGKRIIKPFYQLVALQQEKFKRDKYLRDKLHKEKKMEQIRSDKRASLMNKAMQPAKSSPGPKHLRQKRSVSGMYSLFRPLSVAFGVAERSDSWEGPRRTAKELDFPASSPKAHLTLNLVGAGIRVFINDVRPYTLQLDTEDGAHVLLQATTATERDKWLATIKKIADTSAMKRLTYLGRNAMPVYNEPVDFSNSGPADPTGIFGIDILTLLRRENPNGDYVPGSVPRIVDMCLKEIDKRGLTEVGIHRVAGSKSLCDSLRGEFNQGGPIDLSLDGKYPDIHVVTGVLRQWFRELPESIFTNDLLEKFNDAMNIGDYEERKSNLRGLLWQLPQPNFDIMRRLLEHLDRVCEFEDQNQMTPDSLAICFAMSLCKPPGSSTMNNMGQSLSLIKNCIMHCHYLFSEQDPEVEPEDAIQEEDEDVDDVVADVSSSDDATSPAPEASTSFFSLKGSPIERDYVGSTLEASATETSFFTASDGIPDRD